jgi:ABC-type nitrate/sulfonate/bicarbonate transport system permease component
MTGTLKRYSLYPVLPIGLLLVWYLLTINAKPYGEIPIPGQVVAAAKDLIATGTLFTALLTSIGRVLIGFVFASIVAVIVGLAMGYRRIMEEIADPLIESVRPIAPIALVPLAVLWFGTGTQAAIFIVAYAAFFPMVLNAAAGVRDVDVSLVRAARTMGANELTILRQVILPAAMPHLLVGARLAMGAAWTSVVAAELAVGAKSGAGSTGGIGQLMFSYYLYQPDPNPIVVCMVGVGVVGLAINFVMVWLGRMLMPWKTDA